MKSVPANSAILFADISGSTTLYEKLGDIRALTTIESVLSELRKSVAIHAGRVIKTIGDEVMVVLPTADAAVQTAIDMQNRVALLAPIDSIPLQIRVGFHFGPAIEDGGDFFGDAVNTASRMAGIAKSGQIITNWTTVAALSPLLREATRDLDAMTVRGKQDEIRIFEVIWQDNEELTMLSAQPQDKISDVKLTLSYGGQTTVLDSARSSISMGREVTNDVVVKHMKVSRLHCKIEVRRGKFFLIDQSSNGTYVTVDGDIKTMVKREQFLLRGRGVISLGYATAESDADVVKYICN